MANPSFQATAAVLRKLRMGELITDKELVVAIEVLTPMVEFLFAAGEIFFLPAQYLHENLRKLEDFREARKQK